MSPRITVDASEAQKFEAIDEGRYLTRISQIGALKKGPSARYCRFRFTVLEPDENKGHHFFRNFMMDGGGVSFTVSLIEKVTGEDVEWDAENPIIDFDTDDLLDEECVCVVSVGSYQGDPTNEVERVLSASRWGEDEDEDEEE